MAAFYPRAAAGSYTTARDTIETAPCVQTGGGGFHFYFTAPTDHVVGNSEGRMPGIDIRATGGYAVGPLSSHLSGEYYTWLRDLSHAMQPFPVRLEKMLEKPSKKTGANTAKEKFDFSKGKLIPEGRRNDVLFSSAVAFRELGLDKATGFQMLRFLRDTRCECPESVLDEELATIVGSAWSYANRIDLYQKVREWRTHVTSTELAFLVNLAVDLGSGIPNPSMTRITSAWGLSESTAKRARTKLEAKGFLQYERGSFEPVKKAPTYSILDPLGVQNDTHINKKGDFSYSAVLQQEKIDLQSSPMAAIEKMKVTDIFSRPRKRRWVANARSRDAPEAFSEPESLAACQ